jgi:dihydroorotate dehydrogenase electron transfer subunit
MKSINKPEKINKDKNEVKVEFSAKNITPYGGIGLFCKFIWKLGVEKVLDKVKPEKSQFSLHRYIKCGLGICGACCVDSLRICKDGPVFTGEVLMKSEFGLYRRNECGEKVKI